MKKGTIEFEYIEKGDCVITPEGVGIVTEDESAVENILDLVYSQIMVKLKDGGKITSVDRIMVTKITQEIYEKYL
jgi:hypothetical protein